jgi:hypothetical protein
VRSRPGTWARVAQGRRRLGLYGELGDSGLPSARQASADSAHGVLRAASVFLLLYVADLSGASVIAPPNLHKVYPMLSLVIVHG